MGFSVRVLSLIYLMFLLVLKDRCESYPHEQLRRRREIFYPFQYLHLNAFPTYSFPANRYNFPLFHGRTVMHAPFVVNQPCPNNFCPEPPYNHGIGRYYMFPSYYWSMAPTGYPPISNTAVSTQLDPIPDRENNEDNATDSPPDPIEPLPSNNRQEQLPESYEESRSNLFNLIFRAINTSSVTSKPHTYNIVRTFDSSNESPTIQVEQTLLKTSEGSNESNADEQIIAVNVQKSIKEEDQKLLKKRELGEEERQLMSYSLEDLLEVVSYGDSELYDYVKEMLNEVAERRMIN